MWKMAKLVEDLPTNFKGVHYCYDNERVKMLFSLAMFVWERQTRVRCRIHCGKICLVYVEHLYRRTNANR